MAILEPRASSGSGSEVIRNLIDLLRNDFTEDLTAKLLELPLHPPLLHLKVDAHICITQPHPASQERVIGAPIRLVGHSKILSSLCLTHNCAPFRVRFH